MAEFKDDKEWFKEAKRLHQQEGLNAAQIREKIGFFEGFRIDNSNSEGIRKINLATKLAKDTKRNSKGKVPESTRQFFPEDKSFKTYKKSVGRDKSGINDRTRQASQDKGIQYHKGHIQSSDLGGSTTSRNLRLENGSNNSAHGRSSPSRAALLNTGAPLDWNGDAINYLDPSGLPAEYSPKDKQRILNAPEDQIDEITAQVDKEVWDRIGQNPDARPIRTNPNARIVNPPTTQNYNGLTLDAFNQGTQKPRPPKPDLTPGGGSLKFNPNGRQVGRGLAKLGVAVPLVGLGIGLGQAGHAASQGDYVAAGHTAAALVGEIPIVGDVIVESVAGTGVADGTLQSNLDRVNQTLYQEPKNTAAPTGITAFDNVAQPLIKGLAGQPMNLKPNGGSIKFNY